MDVHVPAEITNGLRLRGIDVITSQEDGTRESDDESLLARATELERMLFTEDTDSSGSAPPGRHPDGTSAESASRRRPDAISVV
jgi:predicted nuclease of predicted toxin-antitoxin system